jgi:hypothetical protein
VVAVLKQKNSRIHRDNVNKRDKGKTLLMLQRVLSVCDTHAQEPQKEELASLVFLGPTHTCLLRLAGSIFVDKRSEGEGGEREETVFILFVVCFILTVLVLKF